MDTVVFDGVTYVKASVAARDFRYTADYLGQLCRGKKIDARLVGRTWFVNPESIKEHKRNRHQKTTVPTSPENSFPERGDLTKEIKTSRKSIPAPVKNKTVKQITNTATESEQSRTRKLMVWYESDQETLIPCLTKKVQPSKIVRIEPVGAKKVHVSGHKKTTASFVPSTLPEVALSGKLTVTSFPDKSTELAFSDDENSLNTPKNKAISPTRDSQRTPVSEQSPEVKEQTVSSKKTGQRNGTAQKKAKKLRPANVGSGRQMSTDSAQSVQSTSFTPTSVKFPTTASPVSFFVRVSPLIATIMALGCVLLLFSASSKLVASDSLYQSQVILQAANLLEIFDLEY